MEHDARLQELSLAELSRLDFAQLASEGVNLREDSSEVEWLRGLGVRLVVSGFRGASPRVIWGPAWVNAVYRSLKSNPCSVAMARGAADPEWAEAALAAYRLGGKKAVADLVRYDEGV